MGGLRLTLSLTGIIILLILIEIAWIYVVGPI